MTKTACIAIDWGTSRLRLWQLSHDGAVIAELRTDEGLEGARDAGFEAILEKHLAALGVSHAVPVIICGMAGSRQGWVEAPYVDTPASLDSVIDHFAQVPNIARDVRVLPGLAQRILSEPDVMRGEETQLLGLDITKGSRLVVMPGTHSKWVEMEGAYVRHFITYLTGELFALFSKQSILRHSIGNEFGFDERSTAFVSACKLMIEQPQNLSRNLFSIRAASLLQGTSPTESAATLSGLLIGAEIGSARSHYGVKSDVTLVGTGALGNLYQAALSMAGFRFETTDGEMLVRNGLFKTAKTLWPSSFDVRKSA